jgi:hypothetical protein
MNPVEKTRAFSLPTRAASFSSRGMVGQAQVVVAAQHDDFFAVVPDGILLGGFYDPEIVVQVGRHEILGGLEITGFIEQTHGHRLFLDVD